MVRVKGPCLSFEAKGKLGNALIFKKRFSTNVVSRYFTPRNPQSADQIILRNRMTKAVAGWQGLSDANKLLWNTYAKQFQGKGYNSYCSKFIDYMIDNAEAEPAPPFLP